MSVLEIDPGFRLSMPYRRLVELLRARPGGGKDCVPAVAVALYTRLFCDLWHEANTTNSPGLLTEVGFKLHVSELTGLGFGDSPDPEEVKQIYMDAGLLVANGADFSCGAFVANGMNQRAKGHQPGKEKLGGAIGGLRRRNEADSKHAQTVAMALVEEGFYTDRQDVALTSDQLAAAVKLINQLDTILHRPGRAQDTSNYPQPLVTAAHDAVELWGGLMVRYKGSDKRTLLELVCYKVLALREDPSFPKATEQVMERLPALVAEVRDERNLGDEVQSPADAFWVEEGVGA